MKKLSILLLIATAALVFAGCTGGGDGTTPTPDGTTPLPAVTIEVDKSVTIGDLDYVKKGNHKVTVTFAQPVTANVGLIVLPCGGDFSKSSGIALPDVILAADADRKVFTGYYNFGCDADYCSTSACCEQQIMLVRGDCNWCLTGDVASVIVDSKGPEFDLEIRFVNCCFDCDPDFESSVYIEWRTVKEAAGCDPCAAVGYCCDDACTEVADWTVKMGDPCKPCVYEGNGCPIAGKSDCDCLLWAESGDPARPYTITFDVKDAVGNKTTATIKITISDAGVVKITDVCSTEYSSDNTLVLGTWYKIQVTGGCTPTGEACDGATTDECFAGCQP